MKQLKTFYQSSSMFPLNMEIAILQVGHQSDFMDNCAYLTMAREYLKQKSADDSLNK